MSVEATLRSYGVGFLIALIIFIICIVLWFIDKPLEPKMVLGLIAALALARLL